LPLPTSRAPATTDNSQGDFRTRSAARKRERMRTRLLAATMEVWSRDGGTAAVIDDVLRQAGASRASFYAHFKTFEEAISHLGRDLADETVRGLAIARSEIDAMAALGGECDFINKVALGYPLRVVMEILGVPREDEPRMLKLTQEIFGPEDPELNRNKQNKPTAEQRAGMLNAIVADFGAYFKTITDDRRVHPRNDVATVLANALLDGEALSDRYLTSYYIIIATAGHDTTSSSIGTAMWALCQFPELLPQLKADVSLIPAFIDEAVRWATPVRHFMRTATADTELRGRRIAMGDWLMLCYWSANRDEDVFDKPFEFRLDRKPNKQIAFGYGRHMCLGMHLARLEMKRLFEELLPRLESVEATAPMELVAANFVGGPKRLPIRFSMS
jgi:cytochrome P450